ncbi:hypothetical protein POM88_012081 [Heracleum sosnowskyi]|uniref:TF-B3 domain-containing protein n=1 Tax=Heracleum sosnowskyi TaxID=360622 RepID=A0AAD8IZM1_9APIA|nr:hypothetical protein POM88_012081 [Heracleum sosnowskyi]
MDLEESHISFMCRNIVSPNSAGSLEIPLVFYAHYGHELPENVFLHVDCSYVWQGKVVNGGKYIEELEDMINYYGIKPYHMVLLQYDRVENFKVQIYNPYAVEIMYPSEKSTGTANMVCNELKLDKLCCTFTHNALLNFSVVYYLVVEKSHLFGDLCGPVIPEDACYRLQLNPCCTINVGFENHFWSVSVNWNNKAVYFGKEWIQFLHFVGISAGDTIAFHNTNVKWKFQLCVFPREIACAYKPPEGKTGVTSYLKFFKTVTEVVLESGELELPRLFSVNYGDNLSQALNIFLGGGMSTTFKYCHVDSKIYVSVYDSQSMNHFRDDDGYFRFADFAGPCCSEDLVVVSDSSNDSDDSTDSSSDDYDIDEEGIDLTDKNSLTDEDVGGVDDLAMLSFDVTLRISHVDQQCHGAYLPKSLRCIFRTWGKRTSTSLFYRGREWNVEVLHHKRSCRFGIGWDDFTRDNKLSTNQKLSFQYVGDFNFHVRLVA